MFRVLVYLAESSIVEFGSNLSRVELVTLRYRVRQSVEILDSQTKI